LSKLHDRHKRHDVFHKKAKEAGFVARSIYKLQEIDERHHVLKAGMRVLDLGCRPGSWLQYAAPIALPRGALVGIDRQDLDVAIPGARIVVGDVFQVTLEELKGDLGGFDCVLSDMAPDTSGVRSMDQARSESLFERALEIAESTLSKGGSFVGKLFQGPAFQTLIQRCRRDFDKVVIVKPKGSRKDSIEQYVVALGRKPSSG
jgi:23S rRNA (uridine2552-2'-O)-methyltransferase